jgi:outer membrane lipoprotein-sorting protein
MYNNYNNSPNLMISSSKFVWLFTNEHEQVLKKLGSFIEEFFLLRGHN